MVKVRCMQCNIEFDTKPSFILNGGGKYCSRTCLGQSQKTKVIKICVVCGASFLVNPYVIKNGYGKYCSKPCQHLGMRKQIKRACAYCGKEFHAPPSDIASGRGKHCSVECQRKAQDKRLKRICEWCGAEFLVKPSRVANGWGNFCSHVCRSSIRTGPKCPRWKGGISYLPYCIKFNASLKERVRDAFGRKCYLCSTTEKENGEKLSVHHCDFNKQQGCTQARGWKLLPLCRICHGKTNGNRHHYFNLLANYWLDNPDIHFNSFN